MARPVEAVGVHVEDFAQGGAGPCDVRHPVQRLAGGVVHAALRVRDRAEEDRPFGLHVVAPVGHGVLDEDLVLRLDPVGARHASPEGRPFAGVEQRSVGREVRALPYDGGEVDALQLLLEDAGPGGRDHFVERHVEDFGRLAHVGKLGRGFHQPQLAHQLIVVLERAPARQGVLQAPEVPAGQAMRVELDCHAPLFQAELGKDRLEINGGVRIVGAKTVASPTRSSGAPRSNWLQVQGAGTPPS
jgi:hypothetical protein